MAAPVVFMSGARFVGDVWDTDTFEVLAAVAAWAPDATTEEFVADMVANELSVAGYARDTVTTPTLTVDVPSNTVTADCDDLDFGMAVAGETAGWVVFYRLVTNDADSELICAIPISRVTDGTALTVTIGAAGVMTVREC